jgi:hypothetical protein
MPSSPFLCFHDGEANKLHSWYADVQMGALWQPISLGRPFWRGATMANSAHEQADHALSAEVRL